MSYSQTANQIFLYSFKAWFGSIPSDLREQVADLYLSRYKKIILWGTGFDPTADKFDALYTDMSWVKVDRKTSNMEQEDLTHYTDMLVNIAQQPVLIPIF